MTHSHAMEEPATGKLFSLARSIVPPLSVIIAACHALYSGWGRWGNILMDTGRELEWPRRILEGENLYSELRYQYGPLAPYLNALLYRLFGVHLDVLATAGAIAGVATSLVVYDITRRLAGRFAGAIAGVTFVYVLGFAQLAPQGVFNFVLPYSFPATYGMLAALLSLALLIAHVGAARPLSFMASVLFLALAALSKPDPSAAALTAHLIFAVAAISSKRFDRFHALGYSLAAIGASVVYGYFCLRTGPSIFADNFFSAINPSSSSFLRGILGLTNIGDNLRALTVSLVLLGATTAAAWGASMLPQWVRSKRAVAIAVLGLASATVLSLALRSEPGGPFRAIPLLGALGLAVSVLFWWRNRMVDGLHARILPHALLSGFTVVASLRIFFAASPDSYGFVLLAPGVAWLAVLLFDPFPRVISASAWSKYAAGTCATALLLGTSVAAIRASSASAAAKSIAFRFTRGTLWGHPDSGSVLPLLQSVARFPDDSKLLVIPYGSAFNFLLSRRGPADAMSEYLSLSFYGRYKDEAVVSRWEKDPPDAILWYDWDVDGARFGLTYAVKAGSWILSNYAVVDSRGPIFLLARRAGSAIQPAR